LGDASPDGRKGRCQAGTAGQGSWLKQATSLSVQLEDYQQRHSSLEGTRALDLENADLSAFYRF
jgi:hypothetical protein